MQNLSGIVSNKLNAEKHRQFAEWLHKYGYVYAMYGLLDGLSVSYSLFKYAFDLLCADSDLSSSDVMHEWLVTPGGISAAVLESLMIIGFSFVANHFSNKDKNFFKRNMAVLWPYIRAGFKGLKNAYKAMASTFRILNFFFKNCINFLIIPFSLTLGIISACNRILLRKYIDEPRKQALDFNIKLLKKIQGTKLYRLENRLDDYTEHSNCYILLEGHLYYVNYEGVLKPILITNIPDFLAQINDLFSEEKGKKDFLYLTDSQLHRLIALNGGEIPLLGLNKKQTSAFRKEIKSQKNQSRMVALVAAGYGGFIDGLYLFMGVVCISLLAPQIFIVMTAFSAFFSIACIGTRIFEEHYFQRKLLITEQKIQLNLCGRELEDLFSRLYDVANVKLWVGKDTKHYKEECFKEIKEKVAEFEQLKNKLRGLQIMPNRLAIIAGLRNGLAVYNILASIVFAYAALNLVFPPALLISCVSAGIGIVIICVAHALIKNIREQRKAQELEKKETENQNLPNLLNLIQEDLEQSKPINFSLAEVKSAIFHSKITGTSQEHVTQTWAEVFRSFFSGIPKGQKAVDFTFNPLQEENEKGHYQDSRVMGILIIISSFFYTLVLTLRAFARGFGKPSNLEGGGDDEAAVVNTVGRQAPQSPSEVITPLELTTKGLELAKLNQYSASKPPSTVNSSLTFFKSGLRRSNSLSEIEKFNQNEKEHTARGLMSDHYTF